MQALTQFWTGLGRAARLGLVGGLLSIVLAMGLFATWALRVDYGLLFANLSQADVAAMAGELDKMKVPYRVGTAGDSLLVPESVVHKTRVALMGRELPLHGAVGFELFNNMEFGVSEFVQKVAYQRALQGELTRTILAIDEVQGARVHLAMAEQGLFRKDTTKSKASVTITTKPGRALQPVQVQGVQRLVAASVPEVQAQDVTVLDQHGVALSRAGPGTFAAADDGGSLLDMKRSIESYLAQKAGQVLDRMYGSGISVVSVDALLSTEQMRVTTEEVLAARTADENQPATGVVLRERQRSQEAAASEGGKGDEARIISSEIDYQTGKRTEQMVSPPGAVKRLNVAVVVKRSLSEVELQRVRDLVGASVGAVATRGDVISVHSMSDLVQRDAAQRPAGEAISEPPPTTTPAPTASVRPGPTEVSVPVFAAMLAIVVLAGAAALLARRRNRPAVVSGLDDAERARLLGHVQQWLTHDATSTDRTAARK